MTYAYVKAARKLTKQRLLAAFGGYCAICKVRDDPCVYDLHHRNPDEKDFSLGHKIRAWPALAAEAAKCGLLCACCHRKVHAGLAQIPEDAPIFSEQRILDAGLYTPTTTHKVFDTCPSCGGPKAADRGACSRLCAAQQKKRLKTALDATTLADCIAQFGYDAACAQYKVTRASMKRWLQRAGIPAPRYKRTTSVKQFGTAASF